MVRDIPLTWKMGFMSINSLSSKGIRIVILCTYPGTYPAETIS